MFLVRLVHQPVLCNGSMPLSAFSNIRTCESKAVEFHPSLLEREREREKKKKRDRETHTLSKTKAKKILAVVPALHWAAESSERRRRSGYQRDVGSKIQLGLSKGVFSPPNPGHAAVFPLGPSKPDQYPGFHSRSAAL